MLSIELRNEQKQFEERLYGGSDVNLIEADLEKETFMFQAQNNLVREQMMVLDGALSKTALDIIEMQGMRKQRRVESEANLSYMREQTNTLRSDMFMMKNRTRDYELELKEHDFEIKHREGQLVLEQAELQGAAKVLSQKIDLIKLNQA